MPHLAPRLHFIRAFWLKFSVLFVAGDKDPWEKVEWGRAFEEYPSVEEFVELPGVGHCPMDENPGLVNPLMLRFVQRHLKSRS